MRVEVSSLLCPCLWVLRGGDVFGSVARGSLYTVDPSASSATRLQPPTTTRARSLTHSLTRLPYLLLSPSLLYCLSHHCRSPLPPSPLHSSLPPFLTASSLSLTQQPAHFLIQPSLPTSLASSLPHSTTTSLPHHSLTALPRSITPSLTPQLRLFIQSHHSHRLNLTFRIRFALLSIRQFETLIANALYACDSLRRSCSHIITLEGLLFDMRV